MINIDDFEGVLFDMDGVLIDSEPLWKIAMQEAFDEVGCTLTKKDFQRTVGLRIDEVINYWYNFQPWEGKSPKEVEERILEKMVKLIQKNPYPLAGVMDTLTFLRAKGLKIGLGTSSYRLLIETVLDALAIRSFFDFTHTAEDEKFGKPHPAVYITLADKLGLSPEKCLVIEDSFTGMIAGKAAKMNVLVIPEKTHEPNPKLELADYYLPDMSVFYDEISQTK